MIKFKSLHPIKTHHPAQQPTKHVVWLSSQHPAQQPTKHIVWLRSPQITSSGSTARLNRELSAKISSPILRLNSPSHHILANAFAVVRHCHKPVTVTSPLETSFAPAAPSNWPHRPIGLTPQPVGSTPRAARHPTPPCPRRGTGTQLKALRVCLSSPLAPSSRSSPPLFLAALAVDPEMLVSSQSPCR